MRLPDAALAGPFRVSARLAPWFTVVGSVAVLLAASLSVKLPADNGRAAFTTMVPLTVLCT